MRGTRAIQGAAGARRHPLELLPADVVGEQEQRLEDRDVEDGDGIGVEGREVVAADAAQFRDALHQCAGGVEGGHAEHAVDVDQEKTTQAFLGELNAGVTAGLFLDVGAEAVE